MGAGPRSPSVERYRGGMTDRADDAARGVTAGPEWFRFTVRGSRMVIALDRPAIVGRAPALPRIITGSPARLVRLPSATNEISSSHLEIRQVGVSVVVTDLRSTNGSVVRMPGQAPRAIRGGESLVVPAGSLIDVGDTMVVEILPRPHVSVEDTPE